VNQGPTCPQRFGEFRIPRCPTFWLDLDLVDFEEAQTVPIPVISPSSRQPFLLAIVSVAVSETKNIAHECSINVGDDTSQVVMCIGSWKNVARQSLRGNLSQKVQQWMGSQFAAISVS
jgi:hypothetical protein